jgi:hypothetical protein
MDVGERRIQRCCCRQDGSIAVVQYRDRGEMRVELDVGGQSRKGGFDRCGAMEESGQEDGGWI